MSDPISGNPPAAYDESAKLHSHRCMRCDEEFVCQTPEICRAQYDVLPSIVTLDEYGRPKITEHCPHLAPMKAKP